MRGRALTSPGNRLLVAVLGAAAMLCTVLVIANDQPYLGLRLAWDGHARGAVVHDAYGPAAHVPPDAVFTSVSGGGRSIRLTAEDFTAEPDASLPTFHAYERFLRRQGELAAIQASGAARFTDNAGLAHVVRPAARRPIRSLPVEFWVQVVVGLFAWLISAGVWAFRPREASARYLLLSGFSTLLFAPLAAVYSTRELALPRAAFLWLSDLNFFGGCLYCATMVALLWYYPRRLGAATMGPIILGVYGGWFAAQELGAFDSMVVARRTPVFVALILTFVLSGVQWRATRNFPVARASLSWFLLSWLVGTSIFASLTMVPQLFGVDMGALQGYAFLLFLLVYGGLAFGILRFRLFQLGEWWFRIFTWVLGALMLVAIDLLLVAGLSMPGPMSLGVALLLCGFLWLPLRSWLWGRMTEPRALDGRDLFRSVLDAAFAASKEERVQRWTGLLQQLFDALRVDVIEESVPAVVIADDGLALLAPAAGGAQAVRISYAARGRRLFSPRDAKLLQQAVEMLRHADESRQAYNQGAREERTRIARDLHDDIGSRLLSGLHRSHVEETKEVISQAMAEMRTIIHGLAGDQLTLGNVLAELRHETALRLDAAGITLSWPLTEDHHSRMLSYAIYKNYASIMRELVANIVRHAHATHVTVAVRCDGERLTSEIQDDGAGFDGAARGQGQGLSNLRRRVKDLQGTLAYTREPIGTRVRVEILLAVEAQQPILVTGELR